MKNMGKYGDYGRHVYKWAKRNIQKFNQKVAMNIPK